MQNYWKEIKIPFSTRFVYFFVGFKPLNIFIYLLQLWNVTFLKVSSAFISGFFPGELKSESHLPETIFLSFSGNPLEIMKNALYFMLKALFVFKFLFLASQTQQ